MFNTPDDKKKLLATVVNKETVEVHIQTTTHRISGRISMRPEEQLKDEVNRPDQFLDIEGASIYNNQHQVIHQCEHLSVNRNQIVWLYLDKCSPS